MFDLHFSPGYYEDTDLAFTVRAAGLRVLYQPFAHVVHQSHTTYAAGDGGEAKMDTLIDRNRQVRSKSRGNGRVTNPNPNPNPNPNHNHNPNPNSNPNQPAALHLQVG
eukprot:scaffold52415_cov44-Phaeocystis_antarctica.AAC.2